MSEWVERYTVGAEMKRKELEIKLQQIPPIPNPSANLEQYSTPAGIAAEILYYALLNGDIVDRTVVDLGCGTGIFAIGAKLLGAQRVWGCDSSTEAVQLARDMAEKFGVEATFETLDVSNLLPGTITFGTNTLSPGAATIDTVIQNPPFGAQKQHADRIFLTKALEIATVTYSLHLRHTREFIHTFTKHLNARITHEENYLFPIKHTFAFHSRAQKSVDVTLFRIVKAISNNQ